MKNISLVIIGCLIIFSCTEKKKINIKSVETEKKYADISNIKHLTLNNWSAYYKTYIDSFFNLNNFILESENTIQKTEGSVYATFNEQFDTVYTGFLIYSPNKQKYIDIDSYQLSIGKTTNELLFEADQEINLIDLVDQKVWRIAFFGPSYWVEDALWQNDSIVLLLQNSYNQIPAVQKININTLKQYTYTYNDTLTKKSHYRIKRINKILKNE